MVQWVSESLRPHRSARSGTQTVHKVTSMTVLQSQSRPTRWMDGKVVKRPLETMICPLDFEILMYLRHTADGVFIKKCMLMY